VHDFKITLDFTNMAKQEGAISFEMISIDAISCVPTFLLAMLTSIELLGCHRPAWLLTLNIPFLHLAMSRLLCWFAHGGWFA
jgi:hypothetical protein